MASPICPYLGQIDDPDTALQFPAAGNACLHALPVQNVTVQHQRSYCLSSAHTACPVYRRATPAPLPAAIAAAPLAPRGLGRVVALVLVAVLAITSLGLLGNWLAGNRDRARASAGSVGVPVTGQQGGVLTRSEDGDENGLSLIFGLPDALGATPANCPPPAGWLPYSVVPTDTLTLLSQLFNEPAEQLAAANCLPANAVLRAGQILYVPVDAAPTVLVEGPKGTATVPFVFYYPLGTPTRQSEAPARVPPRVSTAVPSPSATRQQPSATANPSATVAGVLPTVPVRTMASPTLAPFPTSMFPTSMFPTMTTAPSATLTLVVITPVPVYTLTPVLPPTSTPRRPTRQPSRTPLPADTNTPLPPTPTQALPTMTDTPVPPTPTNPPPTDTLAPPTDTAVPPSDTPAPTATDLPPPTETPFILPTEPLPSDTPFILPTEPLPTDTPQDPFPTLFPNSNPTTAWLIP